ncbi:hypothetical protein PENNAL_c0003G09613 [Penicillium nalgiovense]|uniref:Uncharacterized protein n=1 Tax=Penicillium nalgiovense TaxID=60175 RepID=A0A1V6Z5I5_PENNA|nr:hypothetical protein PENNAL_c0003G09613 [Penicillium nalgiovense]
MWVLSWWPISGKNSYVSIYPYYNIHPEYLQVGFRHGGNSVAFVGYFSIGFFIDSRFHPVTRSTKGETIHAGAMCTIEWNVPNQGHSGPTNTLLKKREISGAKYPISQDMWRQSAVITLYSTLPRSDDYYHLQRISKLQYQGSNGPNYTTSTSATPMATMSPTTSTGCTIITSTKLTGTSATWTSSGAGSASNPIFAVPFAFVGASPAGMLAFYAESEGIQWERFRVLRSCAECT